MADNDIDDKDEATATGMLINETSSYNQLCMYIVMYVCNNCMY